VLEFGSLMFTVKPSLGSRVTSLKLDGDELLTDATENPQYFGSTLWTSPADDWVVGMFTPPASIDNGPYTTMVSADGIITSTSAPFTTPKNNKKFNVTKVFHADLAKQSVIIDYTIKNLGTTPYQLSHWEVTRVFPGGLTFFPTGSTSKVATMACRRTDERVFELVRRTVDDIVLVGDEDMAEASRWLWFEMGVAADLSGAASLAALRRGLPQLAGASHICALVCGAGAEGTA